MNELSWMIQIASFQQQRRRRSQLTIMIVVVVVVATRNSLIALSLFGWSLMVGDGPVGGRKQETSMPIRMQLQHHDTRCREQTTMIVPMAIIVGPSWPVNAWPPLYHRRFQVHSFNLFACHRKLAHWINMDIATTNNNNNTKTNGHWHCLSHSCSLLVMLYLDWASNCGA